ncbi:MAG: motility associated factor glycosyltransferase family protein [Treponema sp.]|nr:motility associated factor glycosyltransferase family protein [Treponema sp.]
MNSIWNKNLQLFKSRFPALADLYHHIIEEITANGEGSAIFSFWKVMPAKNGSLTAQIGNMLLHSSYNPEREAMSTAQELVSKNKETVIFMGAGLGWQFCTLAKLITKSVCECPVKKLVLIEPDPYHFFAALFYIDWSDVFAVEQLVIALGCQPHDLMPLLEGNQINVGNTGLSASYVYTIPAFIQHARPYFDSVIALIERNRSKNDINAATYKKFEKLWIRNSIKNIVHLGECQTVLDIAKDFGKGTEKFIVVAAGPSLEKLLPKMSELKKKAVIVCVETALHALLKAGVEPDFIVITDPQYYAYRHIAGLESPSSVLVCPLSVYPAVFDFKCSQIVLCSEMFPVSGFFEAKLGSFGDLGAGGSVASSAWSLCRLLGARNIYFAGLDLSYPMGQTHIKGSSAEQAGHLCASRVSPVQEINSRSRFSANPEYGTDYNGNKVLTDSRMKMFAWWFESKIAECTDVKTYTLCAESMKIPGVEVATLDDIANTELKRAVPEALEGRRSLRELTKFSSKTCATTISSFLTELNTLTTLINQAVEKCIIAGPNIQNELSIIEQKIAESPLEQIIALARPVTDDRLEMYKSLQKTMGIYNKYAIYYNTCK